MGLFQQSYFRYGLLLVVVLIICLTLMEVTGQNVTFDNKSPLLLIYQFLAPAVIWFFGIRAKKKQLGGKLTLRQGVTEGFKMSLVFAVVSPFVFGAYYLFINPGIVDYVRSVYGLPTTPDSMVIVVDMIVQFVSAVIFGTLYGAILSFFLKNKL